MPLPKVIFSFFLFLFSVSLIAQKGYEPERTYSVEQLKEDFSILHQAFYREHPGWAIYHPEDSMVAWFAETEEKIDRPMTELEFRKILYPLILKIGCGHTRIKEPFSYNKYVKVLQKAETIHHFLPFQAKEIDDRLWVLYNHLEDSTQLPYGTEILEIDGRSAGQIISDLQSMYPADGYNTTHRDLILTFLFDNYYRKYYEEKESYQIRFRKPDGEESDLLFPSNALTFKAYKEDIKKRKPKKALKDSVILQKKGYQLKLAPNLDHTAILRISHFDGKRGVRFYKKAFRYLKETNLDNLVIDLRNNGGGNGKEALDLVSYFREDKVGLFGKKKRGKSPVDKHLSAKFGRKFLFPVFLERAFVTKRDATHLSMGFYKKPQKKNQFKGETMILTNGNTFSSSVIVGAYIKDGAPNTLVIGQESGGGAVSTNAFQMPKLELPHSKVRLIYPFFRLVFDVKEKEQGRGLIPDHQVDYSLEDLLEGNDLEMEVVRKIVKEAMP